VVIATIQPVEPPSVKVERVTFEAMVLRSFRVGLLVGVAFALVKTVQARRSTPSAPPAPCIAGTLPSLGRRSGHALPRCDGNK
jgi:hypothetical protein